MGHSRVGGLEGAFARETVSSLGGAKEWRTVAGTAAAASSPGGDPLSRLPAAPAREDVLLPSPLMGTSGGCQLTHDSTFLRFGREGTEQEKRPVMLAPARVTCSNLQADVCLMIFKFHFKPSCLAWCLEPQSA